MEIYQKKGKQEEQKHLRGILNGKPQLGPTDHATK
jgi:hypothetical protein